MEVARPYTKGDLLLEVERVNGRRLSDATLLEFVKTGLLTLRASDQTYAPSKTFVDYLEHLRPYRVALLSLLTCDCTLATGRKIKAVPLWRVVKHMRNLELPLPSTLEALSKFVRQCGLSVAYGRCGRGRACDLLYQPEVVVGSDS